MVLPGQPQNMTVVFGDCTNGRADPTKACVRWDGDPDATSAELVVTPGLTS